MRPHAGVGLVVMLASCAAFATSGPFAKSLITAGWTPGLVVLLRIGGAAVLLLGPALWAVRGRWRTVVRELPLTALYGMLAVGAAQLGYFGAIARLSVGVALLVEYLGIVLVVLWVWFVTRRPPGALTLGGVVLALTGLALVLDIASQTRPDAVGIAWALLAAVGMAGHYILAARETVLPAITFAGLGLVAGAAMLALLGVTGVIPMVAGGPTVELAGMAVPAWASLAELSVVAAALAYVLGVIAARFLGSTVSSFVGLTEVLFAVAFAWLFLGELPAPIQLLGGAVLLAGVALVRAGEGRRPLHHQPDEFDVEPSPVG